MAIEFDSKFWQKSWAFKKGLERQFKAAILAAGLGKRMDPLTINHLPKPLFPLGGKVPMTEVWVRRFVKSGITDISLNLCVLKNTIKRHFRDGAKFAAYLHYVDEYEPTGTLGGICKQALGRKARAVLPHEQISEINEFKGSTLIAPSGDVVANFGSDLLEEMYEIHKKAGAALSMVLVPIAWERRKDFGTVLMDAADTRTGMISKTGRIREFIEKDPNSPSNLNNASIYMIEMELVKLLDGYRTPADPEIDKPFYDFGRHVFPAMLGKLPYVSLPNDFLLWGIQYEGNWFDVGQKRDYLRVNESLLDGHLDVELPYEKLPWGYVGTNTTIDFSRSTIIPPVVIGNNCIIEPGAVLGPYAIIGDDWIIEKNARIRNSVLWQRYAYFTDEGVEISVDERKLFDRHEIRRNVTVEECIVTGGTIEDDFFEKTVDILEDGSLSIVSIDWVPEGPRA